jgi:YD repeat-containing protein
MKENIMTVYTASYDDKFNSMTYQIGRVYTFNGDVTGYKLSFNFCKKFTGFNFCKKIKDVFNSEDMFDDNHKPKGNIKVYEIEVLGSTSYNYANKYITDKMKIIREMDISNFIKYDENGNVIYYKHSNGLSERYKYDENNNLIYHKGDLDFKIWNKYDKNNNLVHLRNSSGHKTWYKYNENNNLVEYKNSDGDKWSITVE